MIRKSINVSAVAAVMLILLCACNGGGSEAGRDGRMQYMPQENEVSVAVLKKDVFCRHILSNGKLSASQKASLVFGTPGVVGFVNVHEGQVVRKGEILAGLDNGDIMLSLRSAELSLKKAELDLYDVLAGQGYAAGDTASVPENVLEMAKMRSGYLAARNELEKARRSEEQSVLSAPFGGRVADVRFRKWDLASASEPMCTIVDDSVLDVEFTVLESDYTSIVTGLPVKVTPFGRHGTVYAGRIVSINPVVDMNGQVAVRAQISGDGSLADGMNVKVVIEKSMADMLVVPKSAVVIRDNLDVLFRYRDGKAEWVYVNILHSNSDSYAVVANSGRGAELAEGDMVIVSGNLNLADGSSVKIKD